jgi:hypothetical protein
MYKPLIVLKHKQLKISNLFDYVKLRQNMRKRIVCLDYVFSHVSGIVLELLLGLPICDVMFKKNKFYLSTIYLTISIHLALI